ncbi:MAG: threonine/serine dehydratase [Gemmatimonadaceae bacterium]|nr:threonine/serine dehydratase [Gemmatimonadaceae bacterium]
MTDDSSQRRERAQLAASILDARDRLRAHVRRTPFDRSLPLSARLGGEVWLKDEHLQHTGSFKARGALHKILTLSPIQRAQGVVAASSGNHGAGLAWACRLQGVRAVIFVPEQASPAKVAMIERYGAEVRHEGVDGVDTEAHARAVAERDGSTYVSPYNDLDVICGQGTIAVEIVEQLTAQVPDGVLDAIVVAVGGGGLIAGIAAYLKHVMPTVRVIGALPANSPVMAESVAAGRIITRTSFPTLSDGTAGGIEPGAVTFPLCQALVDQWIQVDEGAIAASMRRYVEEHHQVIEGAAGVALAALERLAESGDAAPSVHGARVGVVLCGANISTSTLVDVLQGTG